MSARVIGAELFAVRQDDCVVMSSLRYPCAPILGYCHTISCERAESHVEQDWADDVAAQAGAALAMIEGCIENCPSELWRAASSTMGYWYLVYHSLFFVDHDLSPQEREFRSVAFDVHEYELKQLEPPYTVPYAQDDLLGYVALCRERCRRVLDGLRDGHGPTLRGETRLGLSPVGVLLYNVRHVQHHVGQLNGLLREAGGAPVRWNRANGL